MTARNAHFRPRSCRHHSSSSSTFADKLRLIGRFGEGGREGTAKCVFRIHSEAVVHTDASCSSYLVFKSERSYFLVSPLLMRERERERDRSLISTRPWRPFRLKHITFEVLAKSESRWPFRMCNIPVFWGQICPRGNCHLSMLLFVSRRSTGRSHGNREKRRFLGETNQ